MYESHKVCNIKECSDKNVNSYPQQSGLPFPLVIPTYDDFILRSVNPMNYYVYKRNLKLKMLLI